MTADDHNPPRAELSFSRSVYDLEAVKRAAYELMPKVRVAIDVSADCIACTLRRANDTDTASLEVYVRDFEREVIDQDLRLKLEARTEPLRSAILGLAFSKTGLQDG